VNYRVRLFRLGRRPPRKEAQQKTGRPDEEAEALQSADLDRAFERYQPKSVIHFAALAYVGESVPQPLAYSTPTCEMSLGIVPFAELSVWIRTAGVEIGRLQERGWTFVLAADGTGLIDRAVINHDDFVIRIVEIFERGQGLADGPFAVATANDHGDPRPAAIDRERHVCKPGRDATQRLLGLAIPRREPEFPVRDVVTFAEPLIGPGINKSTGASGFERSCDLPVERFGLPRFAVTSAVESELRHNERAFTDEILQPGKV
jgi:hypothetical protein